MIESPLSPAIARSRVVDATQISYGTPPRPMSRVAVLNTCTGPIKSSSSMGGTTRTTTRRDLGMVEIWAPQQPRLNVGRIRRELVRFRRRESGKVAVHEYPARFLPFHSSPWSDRDGREPSAAGGST